MIRFCEVSLLDNKADEGGWERERGREAEIRGEEGGRDCREKKRENGRTGRRAEW